MRQPYRNRCCLPMITALVLSACALSAPVVMASETTPCLEEIEKYCNQVNPGEGLLKCLQEHDKDLSSVCRVKLAANHRNLLTAQKICTKDIETFCKGVVPGGGRILKCLSGHRDELAPECREIVSARSKPEVKPAAPPAKKPVTKAPDAATAK